MESGATGSTTRPELLAVGQRLKAARELRHLSLESVQEATNIRIAYLQAIEAGRAGDVPGEVFLKGFMRTYANHLGLDGAAIVDGYKQAWLRRQADEAVAEARPQGRGRPGSAAQERLTRLRRARAQPRRSAGRPGWWVAAVALLAVAGWAVDRGLAQPVATSGASASASEASVSRPSPPPSSTVAAASSASISSAPTPATPTVQVQFTPSATGWQGAYLVTGSTGLRITIAASAACWTRRWVDGSPAFTDQTLAETGPETVTWDAAHTLKLQVGNAPGISWIRVDHQPTPPLPRQDNNSEWLSFSLASG